MFYLKIFFYKNLNLFASLSFLLIINCDTFKKNHIKSKTKRLNTVWKIVKKYAFQYPNNIIFNDFIYFEKNIYFYTDFYKRCVFVKFLKEINISFNLFKKK